MKHNFLVLGSGAREHAIADKLSQSVYTDKLFLADCNDGFEHLGEKIIYSNFEDLAQKSKQKNINILIVGPENPLCEGITDIFKKYNISVIGVNKYWSQLESSKHFAKKFLEKHNIKTARYLFVEKTDNVDLKKFSTPYVIKANGLCKGKGVSVVIDENEALTTIKKYLGGEFDEASKKLLIEEFLPGEELSLMSLWDGKNLLSFLPARDFKRINSDINSLNTGGMGAFCPVSLTIEQEKKLDKYKSQLRNALKAEKADFTGFIYSGLIWHEKQNESDFYVLEYNVRLGDPETQALLGLMESDLGEIFSKAINSKLNEISLKWAKETSACLVLAAKGYPLNPDDNKKIKFVPANDNNSKIYYAGVERKTDGLYSKGGRILSICTSGKKPFNKATKIAESIEFESKYFRKDLNN